MGFRYLTGRAYHVGTVGAALADPRALASWRPGAAASGNLPTLRSGTPRCNRADSCSIFANARSPVTSHASATSSCVALVLGTGSARRTGDRARARLCSTPRAGSRGSRAQHPTGSRRAAGVGPAKAARLVAALELGRRATLCGLAHRHPVLGSFDEVVGWARPRLAGLDHEEVWLLSLDGRNGLKSARRIAQGGLHGCALTTRDVLGPALCATARAPSCSSTTTRAATRARAPRTSA